MRALVVGAGVVGQVYGRHLALGGADVTFQVKREHLHEVSDRLTLYSLNRRRSARTRPLRFSAFSVSVETEEVARQTWDLVVLATASTALRQGDWLAEVAAATGDATVVLLQPGPEDRDHVLRYVAERRLVQGVITLIGYPAPLPGEVGFPEPGVAYWFPPLASSPMSGPEERVTAVVKVLRRGGFPARRAGALVGQAPYGGALLIPLIAELERVGWRLDRLMDRESLSLALGAARQAMEAVARRLGERVPLPMRLAARPLPVRAALRLGRRAVPFDLETYLRIHFTKVGDQTQSMLRTYRKWGEEAGLAMEHVSELVR